MSSAADFAVLPRRAASALMMAVVGALCGFIALGLPTFYVYFLGGYVGAAIGLFFGGWLGWRTPLRDTLIVFVCCFGGWLVGEILAKALEECLPGPGLLHLLLPFALPGLLSLAAVLSIFVPLYKNVSFTARRPIAAASAVAAALYLLWRLYLYAYVWQP